MALWTATITPIGGMGKEEKIDLSLAMPPGEADEDVRECAQALKRIIEKGASVTIKETEVGKYLMLDLSFKKP